MSEYIYDDEGPVFMRQREKITRCCDCKWVEFTERDCRCAYMNHAVARDGYCAWSCRKEVRDE